MTFILLKSHSLLRLPMHSVYAKGDSFPSPSVRLPFTTRTVVTFSTTGLLTLRRATRLKPHLKSKYSISQQARGVFPCNQISNGLCKDRLWPFSVLAEMQVVLQGNDFVGRTVVAFRLQSCYSFCYV